METIYGIMEYRLRNEGSKSEGMAALLKTAEGKEYSLYRADCLPYDDAFFSPYDGQKIGVQGTAEEAAGFFCVSSILLEDGTQVVPEALTMDLFAASQPLLKPQVRIPRKLKKQLKKNKNR